MSDAPPYYARLNKQSLNVNPVTNTLKRAYEQSSGGPSLPALRSSILPHRHRTTRPSIDDYIPSELSQRIDELLSRFFINCGISYDCVDDPSLIQLMGILNSQLTLPTPVMMESCITRLAYPMKVKSAVNYQKAVGPLTATLSTYKFNDEIFLAYSIHFFDDYTQRRNAVYMKKLILCEIDGESIITYVRRSINNFNYGNVRFTNMVTVDEELADQLFHTSAVTNSYICFFTYLTRFIDEVLQIDEFKSGLEALRNFILFLRRHSDLYSKFRRMQLSKNGDLDLPCLDNGKWTSTTVFLTKCLILHETFADFAVRFRLTTYITDDTYSKLSYLQRLMSHTRRFAKELSTPESTVSQVVPTVISIRGFLEGKSVGFGFENDVKRVFRMHLQPLLNGLEGGRYDFACLLDPRYGYRESIYRAEKWISIEKQLLTVFEGEDMIISEKCPQETIILKPHSKHIRLTKIKDELKLYRSNLAAARPNVTTNVFAWWGSRMMELINLYNKSRELLAPPAVAIDTELYFGRHGKLTHMASKLSYEQLENALSVVGQQEIFKGRGYISESALAPLISEAKRRQMPRAVPLLPKPPVDYLKPRPVEEPKMPNVNDMMMEPPPAKKANMMIDSDVKQEPDADPAVKIEIAEDSEAPLLEVKSEIVDEGYEDVKPPVLLPNPPNPPTQQRTDSSQPVQQVNVQRAMEGKCNICLRAEQQDTLREVLLPNEKLIVLLGMVVDSKISMDEARYCYSKTSKTIICVRHYNESGEQLFRALEISSPDEIFAISQERLKFLLDYIVDLRGKSIPLLAFKQLFTIYCEKYPPTEQSKTSGTITFDGIFSQSSSAKSASEKIDKPVWNMKKSLLPKSLQTRKLTDRDSDNPITQKLNELGYNQEKVATSNSAILPKSQRQPRKQKLDEDDVHSEDMVIRRVVPISLPEPASKIKNPGKCSYCNTTVERSDLIRVPKSETRRKIWFEKLGDKFERKVKAFENSFICRAHFAKTAFSKTGRLVKNAMPYAIGERVSYEVVEDHLLPSDDDSETDEDYEEPTTITPNEYLKNVAKQEEPVQKEAPKKAVAKNTTQRKSQEKPNVDLQTVVKEEVQDEIPLVVVKEEIPDDFPSTSTASSHVATRSSTRKTRPPRR